MLTACLILLAAGMAGSLLLIHSLRHELLKSQAFRTQEPGRHELLDHLADAAAIVNDTGEPIYANAQMIRLAHDSSEAHSAQNL
jgi:hypothetical protein